MKSHRLRLIAAASVSSLVVVGMLASGCGASGNGTSFSNEEPDGGSGADDDSGKKGDATLSNDSGGLASDSGGGKDSATDAAEKDGSTPADASAVTDASTSDGSTTSDSGTSDAGMIDASTGDAGPTATTLVISEIRSRGLGGGADELVELYNPTASAITLDSTWSLKSRSTTLVCTNSGVNVWVGTGKSIPAHGHFLIVGSSYTQTPAGDQDLSTGVTDATSVTLLHSSAVVDAVCYAYNAAGMTQLTTGCSSNPYTCEGTPLTNPHNNDNATNTDTSLERKPGGASGNGTDSNDNAADFMIVTPSNPQSSTSAPTP
ncbi:MAG: hypothetical protein ABI551_16975 [Polyangiaceae bacterium]